MPTPEPWSILADVAGHLQVSEDTVLRWIANELLGSVATQQAG